jgi:glycosyltransferase involved in cell wall biosynthesis
MVTGTGIKNKLLEALACGRPAVATTLACQGMEVRSGRELLVADDNHAFAAEVLRLLSDAPLRSRLAEGARAYILKQHNWDAVATAYESVYFEAIAARQEAAGEPATLRNAGR